MSHRRYFVIRYTYLREFLNIAVCPPSMLSAKYMLAAVKGKMSTMLILIVSQFIWDVYNYIIMFIFAIEFDLILIRKNLKKIYLKKIRIALPMWCCGTEVDVTVASACNSLYAASFTKDATGSSHFSNPSSTRPILTPSNSPDNCERECPMQNAFILV